MAHLNEENEELLAPRRVWGEYKCFMWSSVGILSALAAYFIVLVEKSKKKSAKIEEESSHGINQVCNLEGGPSTRVPPEMVPLAESNSHCGDFGVVLVSTPTIQGAGEFSAGQGREARRNLSVKAEGNFCDIYSHPTPLCRSIEAPYNYKMTSNLRHKWYGFVVGRLGPRIYTTWEEIEWQVCSDRMQKHKSFPTRLQAMNWVEGTLAAIGFDGDSPRKQNVHFQGMDDYGHRVYSCLCCSKVNCDNGVRL